MKNQIQKFITNPTIYVAAVIGTLAGVISGGTIGLVSGGFIGYQFKISNGCGMYLLKMNADITLGCFIGLMLGGFMGGIFTGGSTIYKMYNKTYKVRRLSYKNITRVLLDSLSISIEISIGMYLGAVIGGMKSPGIGSLGGAFLGALLMLFTTSLEKKQKK